MAEIRFVSNHFMTGKSAEMTRKNYRVSKVKSHLIFYRKASDGVVEIVRILHERMDIRKRIR
jgi:toxin ParE1/3/4